MSNGQDRLVEKAGKQKLGTGDEIQPAVFLFLGPGTTSHSGSPWILAATILEVQLLPARTSHIERHYGWQ